MEKELIDFMLSPESYPEPARKVEHIQTHISHVFLIGEYVYKIKKPVDFGFLDFSTLDKRKHYCEEEVKLNKELSPEIYLGVVAITQAGEGYEIGGDGEAVEYAVKMKRMPQESIMTEKLKKDEVSKHDIKKISQELAGFYENAKRDDNIRKYGKADEIRKNTDQNFEQTKKYVDAGLFDEETFNFIKKATEKFFLRRKKLLDERIKQDKIVRFHGDLHSGNIFIQDNSIHIFDRIEFNEGFMHGDIASDIGFLAMDLDYMGKIDLSKYLISKYVDTSGDYLLYAVLDFYKCYRAYVRAKVTAFMLDDQNISEKEKEEIKKRAQRYFYLAHRYARVFDDDTPVLLISCGITATGKSKWIKFAADMINATVIRTDVVRREVFGLAGDEEKTDEFYAKYYNEESKQKVYDEIYKRIGIILGVGGKVAFDAAFHNKDKRQEAKDFADRYDAKLIIIYTTAKESTIKNRIIARSKEKNNVSDANIENTLKFFKENFVAPSADEGSLITLDTENREYTNIKKLRENLGEILKLHFRSLP